MVVRYMLASYLLACSRSLDRPLRSLDSTDHPCSLQILSLLQGAVDRSRRLWGIGRNSTAYGELQD